MKIRYALAFFLFCIISLANLPVKAETNPIQSFKYLTTLNGFDNNTIWAIHQDKTGFIWFGTMGGLYKYDGRKLKNIKRNFFGQDGAASVVGAITEDVKNNRLWMLVDNKLFSLDLTTENIQQKDILKNEQFMNIYADKKGRLWISSSKSGLSVYDSQTDKLTVWNKIRELSGKTITEIREDQSGVFSFLTTNDGLYFYDEQKGAEYSCSQLTPEAICSLKDSKGRIWLGTWRGLYLWDKGENCFTKVSLSSSDTKSLFAITGIVERSDNSLYISTDRGLFTYNIAEKTSNHYKSNYLQKGTLNSNFINTIYLDNEKTLWAGTYFGGANYITENSKNFLKYDFINHKMGGHVVSSFAEDQKGNLWIGTEDGGISFYNKATKEITNFNPLENKQSFVDFYNVHTLMLDNDELYIGMANLGVEIINLKTNKVKKISNSPNSYLYLPGCNVFVITKVGDNQIAFGTQNGVSIYDNKKEKIEHVDAIPEQEVKNIIVDYQKGMWVCSNKFGIYYKKYNGEWVDFGENNKNIPTKSIFTIKQMGTSLYICTEYKGIVVFDLETKKYTRLFEDEFSKVIVQDIVQVKDYLWISTSNGLYQYSLKDKSLKNYNENQGLKSKQMCVNAGILTKDGTLFFGSINGLNGFNPDNLFFNKSTPSTVFTNLRINNEIVTTKSENTPLTKVMPYTQSITLSPGQSNISIEFATLSYIGEKESQYKYRLSPIDTGWTTTSWNTVNFNHLPPGEYTLMVCGCNGDGIWDEKGCSLGITVLPPWWATWYMYVCYVLLFALVLTWIFLKYKKKQERRIEEINIKKKEEIYQSKIEFFTNVIHDIRTPLTLILSPLQALRQRSDTAPFKFELDMMDRNGERLLSNINQLMDFRKAEQSNYADVKKENIDVLHEISKISYDFRLAAENKNITINVNKDCSVEGSIFIEGNREMFDKIFVNLVSNALKFTRTFININLSSNVEGNKISIGIQDDGVGISEDFQKHIFEPFYQVRDHLPKDYIGTGIGLSIVKKSVEELGGTIELQSEPEKGAYFIVTLPTKHVDVQQQQEIQTTENEPEQPVLSNEDEGTPKTSWSIAIAEDNDDMRKFIASLLRPVYQVYEYANGKELLDDKENKTFDLIVSDVMMPEVNGYELCKSIKDNSETCHIPVILLTAKIMEDDEVEGFEHGADAYIRKPFSTHVLLARIRNLIKNRERLTSAFRNNPDTKIEEVVQNQADREFVNKLNDIIEKNINSPSLSAQFVASELCMCRTLFFSKMKAVSGVTFVDYVRIIRLKKAVTLMKTEKLSLQDISDRVGFSSLSYFSKTFKKQFNQTPSEYLKQLHVHMEA